MKGFDKLDIVQPSLSMTEVSPLITAENCVILSVTADVCSMVGMGIKY